MSARTASIAPAPAVPTDHPSWSIEDRRIVRYALGATLAMAVAMGFGWTLSFLVPVLTLTLLASPGSPVTLRSGLAFVVIIGVACWLGWRLGEHFVPYQMVYMPLVGLVLFRIFYAGHLGRPFPLIMMLLIAVMVIPLTRLIQPSIALLVAKGIFFDAVVAVVIALLAYTLIPEPPVEPPKKGAAQPAQPLNLDAAFRDALVSTIVVLPLLMIFYFFELTGAVVVLVFVGLLSSRPALAANFKVGKALIAGNLLGGLITIIFFNLLVMVPLYFFMLALTLLLGLVLGSQVFSDKPAARIFGMAFSTTLLIIGSTTTSDNDAGGEVYTRIVQITIAVVYVVFAFRFWNLVFPKKG